MAKGDKGGQPQLVVTAATVVLTYSVVLAHWFYMR